MDNMIDRVAKSLLAEESIWPDLSEAERNMLRRSARRAIEIIRTPNNAMVLNCFGLLHVKADPDPIDIWQSMIDAILQSPQPEKS
jgi:hypothetical protein